LIVRNGSGLSYTYIGDELEKPHILSQGKLERQVKLGSEYVRKMKKSENQSLIQIVENFEQEAALVMKDNYSGIIAFCDFEEISHSSLKLKELGLIYKGSSGDSKAPAVHVESIICDISLEGKKPQ
jgi:hypothetical protein